MKQHGTHRLRGRRHLRQHVQQLDTARRRRRVLNQPILQQRAKGQPPHRRHQPGRRRTSAGTELTRRGPAPRGQLAEALLLPQNTQPHTHTHTFHSGFMTI